MPDPRDWDVGRKMRVFKRDEQGRKVIGALTSNRIAEKLGLEVFQITARLAAMEKRGVTRRTEDGRWRLTKDGWALVHGPRPAEIVRVKTANGAVAIDDSHVPEVRSSPEWKVDYVWYGPHRMRLDVFTDPSGQKYVVATDSEPADLILRLREHPNWVTPENWFYRLRRLEHSVMAEKVRRMLAIMERRFDD
jgi:hypothetical protein